MTYEEYLDEVATLLTEIYTLRDEVAIGIVMRAQADDYFSAHDDDPALRSQERAEADTRTVFKRYKSARKVRGDVTKSS
ncbi:MAG: hypothetical protein ABI478_04780 [Propionivibrio sp.]